MEQLLELILGGGMRFPLFDPGLLELDRGLPKSELFALLLLQRRGESTMSELAADLGAPLSTATGIGERLARRGLVERHRQPTDRRVVVVRLTPAGLELAQRLRSQIDALLRRVQDTLTPAEMTQLVTLVTKVLGALQPVREAGGSADLTTYRQIPLED